MRDGEWRATPEWAKWVAQDPDGRWWFYDRRPRCLQYIRQWESKGRKALAKSDHVHGDWRKMIVRVER